MSSATVYRAESHSWPSALGERAAAAAALLREFGPLLSKDAAAGRPQLHIALSYHCCVGKQHWPTIKAVADSWPWRRIQVKLAPLTCAISALPDIVNLILPLDPASSVELEEEAAYFEGALRSRGVAHIPHAHLQQHHVTLASVNATLFRVTDALTAVNARFPVWSDVPFELERARCHRCDTLVSRQEQRRGKKNG